MDQTTSHKIKDFALPLNNSTHLDPLLDRIGDAQTVMLGEASHGTHEYYTWRSKISKRLIEEKGFTNIAVEGDWPDCMAINTWIKNLDAPDRNLVDVLTEFQRWPTWMWSNWEVAALATWLKNYNYGQLGRGKIGFYGMDVYSLWDSLKVMINYLEKEDPKTAKLAKRAWKCFEPYQEQENYSTVFKGNNEDCKNEVIELLQKVRHNAMSYDSRPEAGLNAEINALVIANAENYYKSMAVFNDTSWNVRDRHMMETLRTLKKYNGNHSKIIVWAHNTHVGDARATPMHEQGLVNIGQLAREQYGKENVVIVGFGSNSGSVIAGDSWGAPMREMDIPEAMKGSLEATLHENLQRDAMFIFEGKQKNISYFNEEVGQRAIGVVYNPHREVGNYVPSYISKRYDAFIYLDRTKAIHPLINQSVSNRIPETYPFGV